MPVKAAVTHKDITLGEAITYMTESIAESMSEMSRKMAESKAETEAAMAKSRKETEAAMAKSRKETEAIIAKSRKETEAIMAETEAKRAETEAAMAKSRKETEAAMAKSQAESDAKRAESAAIMAESAAIMAKSQAETDRVVQEMARKIDELTADVKATVTGFGTMGQRFGEIVELVVIPGLRRAINPFGHDFKRAVADKKFTEIGRNGQKRLITEVDLFLSNGTEAMAVEIKATLRDTYVTNHLNRLKLLRESEKETRLTNKRLYGAVAGIYIEPDARALALKNGLYVIDILEDEKMLGIDNPVRCRVW